MRRFIAVLGALLVLAGPAFASPKARTIKYLTPATTVSTAGGAETVSITGNPNHSAGYLVIETTTEVATASLVATIVQNSSLGAFITCTLTAITTETTTIWSFGTAAAASDDVAGVCPQLVTDRLQIVLTVSGGGASFDVEVEILWAATTGH